MTRQDLIRLCQTGARESAHDFEDTLQTAFTRRDCWTINLALTMLAGAEPALETHIDEMRTRMAELVEVQKPHWVGK